MALNGTLGVLQESANMSDDEDLDVMMTAQEDADFEAIIGFEYGYSSPLRAHRSSSTPTDLHSIDVVDEVTGADEYTMPPPVRDLTADFEETTTNAALWTLAVAASTAQPVTTEDTDDTNIVPAVATVHAVERLSSTPKSTRAPRKKRSVASASRTAAAVAAAIKKNDPDSWRGQSSTPEKAAKYKLHRKKTCQESAKRSRTKNAKDKEDMSIANTKQQEIIDDLRMEIESLKLAVQTQDALIATMRGEQQEFFFDEAVRM